MKRKFYLTTAIPYVNAPPHVGHALEFTQADCVARYHRLLGDEVFLTTGADENALKNVQVAEQEGITPLELCTDNLKKFQKLAKFLNINFSVWRRGSDQKLHWPGVQELWRLCQRSGDIYKRAYKGLYCVGCEVFLTKKELVDGKCPFHLKKPELVEEENYFFRLSREQKKIEKLIEKDVVKVVPKTRKNEILSFIKQGLEDFSVSRTKQRARGWGIPVPDDPQQIIYVWYDALTVYMTGVGWGYDEDLWKKWWPADLHVIGKDIIRFHAVYWIGMLLSAKLPLPKTIFVHGFVISGGQKMSKTLGNVIDPFELIKKFGRDAVRYYFLREIPSCGDGDLTIRRFKEVYNADLANGLGNLVARVAKLAKGKQFNHLTTRLPSRQVKPFNHESFRKYHQYIEEFRFNEALSFIFEKISGLDRHIEKTKPWKTKNLNDIYYLSEKILEIASLLEPFLPETTSKIKKQFSGKIKTDKPLFPRIGTSYHAT